jgi:lactate permease
MHFLGIIGVVPFAILFAGLTATKLKSYIVGFGTLVVTVLLAAIVWHAPIHAIGFGILEGFLIAVVPILWVIFAAVFTYFLGVESGAIETIKHRLSTVTPDRNIQAVLIAFCLGGFLESVAGFGTAVAIPSAMLIALGFNPVRAAVIALVANSVPVAFGALGIPVIVLSRITSLDLSLLTRFVVIQLAPFALLVPLALLIIANGSFRGIRSSLKDVLLIGIVFSAVQTVVGFFIGPELVAVAGSLASMVIYIGLKKFGSRGKKSGGYAELARSTSNYIILLVLVLATRLTDIPALKTFPFAVNIDIGGHTVLIDWLITPGTLLFIAAVAGARIQRLRVNTIVSVMFSSLKKISSSALTIFSIVALAKVMGYSGIIASVATSLSTLSGKAYPLFAPLIGALGTFVTGSDTTSNILLGELQKNAALGTGYDPSWIVASNTSGATAGKMISPQSIAVAAATTGLTDERAVIRITVFYCAGYAIVLGIYVFIVANFI